MTNLHKKIKVHRPRGGGQKNGPSNNVAQERQQNPKKSMQTNTHNLLAEKLSKIEENIGLGRNRCKMRKRFQSGVEKSTGKIINKKMEKKDTEFGMNIKNSFFAFTLHRPHTNHTTRAPWKPCRTRLKPDCAYNTEHQQDTDLQWGNSAPRLNNLLPKFGFQTIWPRLLKFGGC